MSKKTLVILASSALVLGALLVGAYTSGVMRFGDSGEGEGNMSLQGDFGSSGTSMAQIYGSLNDALRASSTGVQAEQRNDHIALIDAASGNEVATIRPVSENQVVISGVIANVGNVTGEQRNTIKRQIDDFNMSSSVGTMELTPAGEVTMKHNVDPQRNTPEQIAKTAVTFGDKARQQAQRFNSFKTASNS